jgi:hypothetical protein
MQQRRQIATSLCHHHYYYYTAAVAIGIAGIVHLLMPLYFAPPTLHFTTGDPIFFLGSRVAQIFWILSMIKRWGKPWYSGIYRFHNTLCSNSISWQSY